MDKLIPRNNTSFLKNVHEVLKSIAQDKGDPLKYHQRLVHEYLLYYPHIRGILAYWEMGAGKTLLAVSVCDSVVQNESSGYKKILFVSSKTLHGNFVGDYKKYLKMINNPIADSEQEMEKYIEKNCQFITLTANNMLQQVYKSTKMEGEEIFTESIIESSEGADVKKLREELEKLNALGNLDNTFIMIDEAHNFFNGITNGSKNYIGLYQLIMEAKNIKILFLTGSPITNDPFEIGLCFNMLNGYYYESSKKSKKSSERLTLFGEEYDDFRKYFVVHPFADQVENEAETKKIPIPIIKNKEKFANRIVGLVSYYGTDQAAIQKLFPKLEELIIQKVPMSAKQYAAYAAARDKEQEESKRGMFKGSRRPLQKPQGASSSYRVRSRQISNFLYPKYASKAVSTSLDEKGQIKYEKNPEGLRADTFKIVEKPKKTEAEEDFGLETWSPKMLQMLINISIHLPAGILDEFKKLAKTPEWMPEIIKNKQKPGIGPGIIYSQFIDSGIGIFGRILEHYGLKEIKNADEAAKITSKTGTFAIISGDVPPEFRIEIVRLAISPENKNGSLLSLLLITATGAEGISTKYMRHVHAIEPFWHWSRLAQVFARAARLGSHVDLPESERTVQPYLYLSDYPAVFEDKEQMKIKTVEDTTDVTLYYKAIQNQILINSFLKTIKEVSIDCHTHYSTDAKGQKSDIHCKICAPTNEPLFIADLDSDMKSPSPCQELKEEKIKATSITLEDDKGVREYMYYYADKQLHILAFNPQLNAYQEIFEYHPDYYALYEKINKKSKK